jgi:hypothetical protein
MPQDLANTFEQVTVAITGTYLGIFIFNILITFLVKIKQITYTSDRN